MNALARETSPYLRQHAGNPVDWLPWGPEALARAREEDKPLLVSIGYSACHWCHVMERECFEDEAIAAQMNESFVCVKVDREERPDVDAIYMEAVQTMTGTGGWPLNVFCTPEQTPFFAGTYFPPAPRQNMPSWPQVLAAIAEAWTTQRADLEGQGARVAERLVGGARLRPSPEELSASSLDGVSTALRERYDAINGGWGGAPKFPAASTIELLLARGELAMSAYTLTSMASGGIYDQVGGGFARYAVDGTWTVPHFEKMLYDNALLARAYLHGFLVTGKPELRRVCEETLDWLLRDLRGPEGGFYSAYDADSEGVEGKFYVWTLAELRDALGEDAEAAIAWFGATEQGNFVDPHHPAPGQNVLEDRGPRPAAEVVARIRARLLVVRQERVWPGLDDKRLAAWNALAIAALADAGAALERPDYVEAAARAADFVLGTMRVDGRLQRTSDGTRARLDAYLEDHAFLLEALLVLYEASFEERWFVAAVSIAEELLARFHDGEHGGFFSTASDAEPLVTRRKDLEDHPIPAGGSSAAYGLLRLAALTGEHRYEAAALGQLQLLHEIAVQHPQAFGHLLRALDLATRPRREVAIVGPEPEALLRVVRGALRPEIVLAGGSSSAVPLLEGRGAVDGRAAAYVCEGFACQAPIGEAAALAAALDGRS